MKRRDLVNLLEKNGWRLLRHGGEHDVYIKESKTESVPRHTEVDENLARAIIRRQGLK